MRKNNWVILAILATELLVVGFLGSTSLRMQPTYLDGVGAVVDGQVAWHIVRGVCVQMQLNSHGHVFFSTPS